MASPVPTTPLSSTVCSSKAVHAYILQVIVLTNHMNGKDTHIRGLRILGPEESVGVLFTRPYAHASPQERARSGRHQRPFPVDDRAFQDVQTDSLGLASGTLSNDTVFKTYIKDLIV